jgi:hypothetical protein
MSNLPNSQIGLVKEADTEDPPGYVVSIETHLSSLATATGTTDSEKSQIIQLNAALNIVNKNLLQIQTDAQKLFEKTISVNPNPNTKDKRYHPQILNQNDDLNTLNDMYAQSVAMYYGQYDPATGNRIGGSLWITDHIQNLATLTIKTYGS